MNYYPHHIGDFNNATRHLSRLERGIYRDLIELYYDTEKPLMLDIPALCRRILAQRDDEPNAVEVVLKEFFTQTDEGWFHERCQYEIEAYYSKADKAKESAAKRWHKPKNADSMQTECERNANAMPTHTERNANQNQNQNHNHNQEPIKEKAAPIGDLFSGIDPQVVADFKSMRTKQKAAITKTSIEGIQREADKAGIGLEAALRVCCERGWRGFKADWITPPQAVKSNLGIAGQSTAIAAQKFLENLSHE